MKHLILISFLILSVPVHAQIELDCQRIGFADTQFIVSNMPELKSLETTLASFGSTLESELNTKYREYEDGVKAYEEELSSMTTQVRQAKEAKLIQMRQSLQKFQEDAERSYLKKQRELMAPIYLKIGKSIEEVATENKYNVIINSQTSDGQRILLFVEKKADISLMVLKKMGVNINQSKRP